MYTPTEIDLQQLLHRAIGGPSGFYDPAKAHQYYEKHKHLKGRRKGQAPPPPNAQGTVVSLARAKQKAELKARITNLSQKLQALEQLIQKKEATLRRDQASAKSKAKRERGAKEHVKPKTAAEKAKAARESSKKYRQQHQQKLKSKAKTARQKSGSSSGGKSPSGSRTSKQTAQKPAEMHIKDLKALATKIKGQLALAKQKLAAL